MIMTFYVLRNGISGREKTMIKIYWNMMEKRYSPLYSCNKNLERTTSIGIPAAESMTCVPTKASLMLITP